MSPEKNTKVAFIAGIELPFQGAAWRRIEYFARYISLNGFTVYVLSPNTLYLACSATTRERTIEKAKSLNIFRVPLKLHICTSPLLTSLIEIINSLVLGIVTVLMGIKVIILSTPPFHYLLGIYLTSRFSKSKLVIDMRDPIDHSFIRFRRFGTLIKIIRRLEYVTLYGADAILTASEALARDLSLAMPQLSEKIHVLPNGADLAIFKPLTKQENREELRLFFMGRMTEGYSLPLVLRALSLLNREGLKVKLYIAGTADPYTEAEKLGIKDAVIYLGVLPANSLVRVMSSMDMAVLPYYNDVHYRYSLPAKFYEYIACGLPVLVSAPPYFEVAKITRQHGVGILCPADDINCIISVIKELYLHREKLAILREQCLIFRKAIDRAIFARKLIALLTKL